MSRPTSTFDPAADGIDFYESLEGMRVQVNNAVAVGPRNGFGEIWVLADNGVGQGVRTTRGGIVIQESDFNPERIQIDDTLPPPAPDTPFVDVGATFPGAIVGVLDYSFGNFDILATSIPSPVASEITREVTEAALASNELSVATFNVENLDPSDPDSKFQELAALIVDNLKAPDLISLEEIQDNSGPTNNGIVAADQTLTELIAAIQTAGGPTYEFKQINPLNGQDGGEPGGNIRVGFLFRTDRGLAFVDRAGGDSTTPNAVVNAAGAPELLYSPGRIDPANSAFNASRKPLAAEFTFNGRRIFAIANHFNSKGGDQPLFGRFQPPTLTSEAQRQQQATIVKDFVDDILALDPDAAVIVLGDLNDFEFATPLEILKGAPQVLTPLIETLPAGRALLVRVRGKQPDARPHPRQQLAGRAGRSSSTRSMRMQSSPTRRRTTTRRSLASRSPTTPRRRSTTSRAMATPSTPGTFTVEAIVVGDYQTQGSGQLRGFFLQEEDADADADPATSEGIFVFCSACPVAVSVGDAVRVTGDVQRLLRDEPADRNDRRERHGAQHGQLAPHAGDPSNCPFRASRTATSRQQRPPSTPTSSRSRACW